MTDAEQSWTMVAFVTLQFNYCLSKRWRDEKICSGVDIPEVSTAKAAALEMGCVAVAQHRGVGG